MAFFSRFRKSKGKPKAQKDPIDVTANSSRPISPRKQEIPQRRVQNFSRPISTTLVPEESNARLAAKQTAQVSPRPKSTTLTPQELNARLTAKQTTQVSPRPKSTTLTPQELNARLTAKQTTQVSPRPKSTTLTPQEFSARLTAKQTIQKPARPASTTLTPKEFSTRLAAKETVHISARPASTVLTPDEFSARIAARRKSTSAVISPRANSNQTLRHSRSWAEFVHGNRPPWGTRESQIPAVRRLQLQEFSPQSPNRRSYATRRKSPLSNLAMVQEPDESEFDSEPSQKSSQDSSRRTSISSRSSVNDECLNCKSSYKSDSSLLTSDSEDIKGKHIVNISVTATKPNDEPPLMRRTKSSTVPGWRYSSIVADAEPIMVDRVQPFQTRKLQRRSMFFHKRTVSLNVH